MPEEVEKQEGAPWDEVEKEAPEDVEENQEVLPGIETEARAPDPAWEMAVAKLKEARGRNGALAAPLLEEDGHLLELFLMWHLVPLWRVEPVKEPPATARIMTGAGLVHQLAWTGMRIGWGKIGQLLGIKDKKQVRALVEKAKGLGMVWPDGTVNETLLAYMTARLGSVMLRSANKDFG